jgi:hypothetical protein
LLKFIFLEDTQTFSYLQTITHLHVHIFKKTVFILLTGPVDKKRFHLEPYQVIIDLYAECRTADAR